MKISGYITGDVPGLYVIIVQNDINSVQPVTGQVTMGWSSEFSKTTGALIFFLSFANCGKETSSGVHTEPQT